MKPEQIAFARLIKVDEEKRLVYGRACQEVVDRVGEIFDYESSKPLFQKWSKSQLEASMGKSAGNIRAMHKDVAAGVIVPEGGLVFHDDERAIDVCSKIVDDAEWAKVLSGTYTGYSIGGSYAKKWEDPELKRTRYTGDPIEISLVDRPAVPTATFFEIQKRDGSMDVKPFKQDRKAMIAYLVEKGQKAEILAKAPDDDIEQRYVEAIVTSRLEDLRTGKSKPAATKAQLILDGKDLATFVDDPKVGDLVELGGKQYAVQKVEAGKAVIALAPADEQGITVVGSDDELAAFAKLLDDHGLEMKDVIVLVKRGLPNAEPTEVEIEAVARTLCEAKGQKPDDAGADKALLWKSYIPAATDAARKAKAKDDLAKPRRAPGAAKKFADEANKKYPIDTEEQIRAAWDYIHGAAATKKYSADEIKMIRTAIALEWKAKIDKDGPPAPADATKAVDALANAMAKMAKAAPEDKEAMAKLQAAAARALLRKGLYTCAEFAYLINSLCGLAEGVEWEAYHEGDGSQLHVKIREGIALLGEALGEMVEEEIAEQIGTDDAGGGAMALRASLQGLSKRLEALEKGASEKHLVVKAAHMQKCHDHVVKMGAACSGAMDKAATPEMIKAHVAVAQEHLDKCHKMLNAMGSDCSSDGKDDDDAKKAAALAQREALKKAHPTLSEVQLDALLKAEPIAAPPAAAPADPLSKAIEAALAPIKQELAGAKATIAKLEAEPRAPKARLLAVSKADDVDPAAGGGATNDKAPGPVFKADGVTIDADATALAMTKWVQSRGKPLVDMKR